jgi:spermidine/putrescine-binding protein
MKSSRLFLLVLLLVLASAGLFLVFRGDHTGTVAHPIRMLAYSGYDEPEFLAPLEKALSSKVTVDTYVGGEEMYTKFT